MSDVASTIIGASTVLGSLGSPTLKPCPGRPTTGSVDDARPAVPFRHKLEVDNFLVACNHYVISDEFCPPGSKDGFAVALTEGMGKEWFFSQMMNNYSEIRQPFGLMMMTYRADMNFHGRQCDVTGKVRFLGRTWLLVGTSSSFRVGKGVRLFVQAVPPRFQPPPLTFDEFRKQKKESLVMSLEIKYKPTDRHRREPQQHQPLPQQQG